MSTAAIRRYWNRVAALGCVCCGRPAEIAHAHGGSIIERGRALGRDYSKAKGKKLDYMDWLVLPLCPEHGRHPYPNALDTDVDAWERRYGKQSEHIDVIARTLVVDVWGNAKSRHEMAVAC